MEIEMIGTKVKDELFEGIEEFLISISKLIENKEFEKPYNCGIAIAEVVFVTLRFLEKAYVEDSHHGEILVAFASYFDVLIEKLGIEFQEEKQFKGDKVFITKPSRE